MKKVIIVAVALFIRSVSIAQTPTFDWGLYISKGHTDQANTKIIYADATFFYTVNEVKVTDFTKAPVIEKFNNKYERMYSKTVDPPTIDGEPLRYRKTEWVNDNMYVFYTGFYKKEQQFKLFLIIIDKEGAIGQPQVLDYLTAEKRGTAEFDVRVSEDRNKLLVLKEAPYVKDVPSRKVTATVFSVKEKTNYQKIFEVADHKSSLFKWIYVTNEGAAFIVRETAKEIYNISHTAWFIHPAVDQAVSINPGEPDKMPLEAEIITAQDGNIVVGGLYSENLNEKVNGPKSHGTFLSKYDKSSGAKLFSVFQPYHQEVISKMKITGVNGLRSFILKALLPKEDGRYFVVAEESWTKEELKTVNSVVLTTIQYDTGPIMVTQLNASGNKDFQNLILKKQQSTDDLGRLNSVLSYTKANKLFLFYNDYAYKYDDKKQVFIIDPRLVAPRPVLMRISSDGSSELDSLDDAKVGGSNGTTFFRPCNAYVKDQNTLIVNAISNKYFTYGKMILP